MYILHSECNVTSRDRGYIASGTPPSTTSCRRPGPRLDDLPLVLLPAPLQDALDDVVGVAVLVKIGNYPLTG